MSGKENKKYFLVLGIVIVAIIISIPILSNAGERLEVMGFYLGMSADAAVKNINKLGIDNYQVLGTGISFGKDLGNWLQTNNANKINYILFNYRLFDAQDLAVNDFANKFSRSYHINLKFDAMRNAYVYQKNYCEVLIPSDPMGIVIIQEIPKPEFNING